MNMINNFPKPEATQEVNIINKFKKMIWQLEELT